MSQDTEKKLNYKDTLNLPHTDFPIRAQHATEDQQMLERWEKEKLAKKAFNAHAGAPKFILHDGPPYANGNIHLGHALNKILKDIIGKAKRMMGHHVPITPGWDCHGLPIEFKVSQDNPHANRTELKKACRAYAAHWIAVQKEEFKQLAVSMDWDNPYLTMDYAYEAAIIRGLATFVEQGYIERKNKTVPWCFNCQTVLATAEIEYQDRKDPSVYVLFPLTDQALATIAPELVGKEVNLLVWTTTPWTLPLNRAVLLRAGAEYVILNIEGTYIITARQRADAIAALKGQPAEVIGTFNSGALPSGKLLVHHPFVTDLQVPIILDASVSLEDGTAAVHCAPGCGPEDYEVGVRNNLAIYSPVAPNGTYTDAIAPKDLVGMSVTDGQWWVLRRLQEVGKLWHKENITHSYPHCWRCHNGLIFRATKQWFCDLSQHALRAKTVAEIDSAITMLPESAANRLKATMEGRLEWCLSRQRVWGVPIPAIIHDATDTVFITKPMLEQVAQNVAREGIEWWDSADIKDLLPADFDYTTYPLHELRKEQDILDVWFDSGLSFYAVLMQRSELAFPADLYLEGKDQHRGWFQSSLLASMVITGKAPMRQIVTHGFTVDEKGRKMSKSIGNVVSPQDIIADLGVDGLRLWVASIDSSGDAVVSKVLLANVKEVYRKIRNTCRFLLSNLYDFNIEHDAIPFEKLLLIDQAALRELYALQTAVIAAYERMDFTAVFHMLADYVTTDLSAFYLDIIKDRLYVEAAAGHKRRSAQTACWYILDAVTKLIAPILSCTAEQVSDHYQQNKQESIHLQTFASLDAIAKPLGAPVEMSPFARPKNARVVTPQDMLKALHESSSTKQATKFWGELKQIRSALLKAIEQLREQGIIKHSLEARIRAYVHPASDVQETIKQLKTQLAGTQQTLDEFFKEFLIVSQFILVDKQEDVAQTMVDGLYAEVTPALGVKCPRCWHWNETAHADGLCDRCAAIIKR
jgi:isoleucyl-tRNA synthetase